ncbi:hypothetical protein J6590_023671 [Homalodisca vitripennis]|nr:hypothetical protein J6590_023671 [Homalodisca vitripennis]
MTLPWPAPGGTPPTAPVITLITRFTASFEGGEGHVGCLPTLYFRCPTNSPIIRIIACPNMDRMCPGEQRQGWSEEISIAPKAQASCLSVAVYTAAVLLQLRVPSENRAAPARCLVSEITLSTPTSLPNSSSSSSGCELGRKFPPEIPIYQIILCRFTAFPATEKWEGFALRPH